MSMRFAYKYPFFKISNTKNHNFLMYMVGKYGAKMKALPVVNYELEDKEKVKKEKWVKMLQSTHLKLKNFGSMT